MVEGYTQQNAPVIEKRIQESIQWLEKTQEYIKNNNYSDTPFLAEFQIREHLSHAKLKIETAIKYMDNPIQESNEQNKKK